MSESQHQRALFEWAAVAQATMPELRLLYAIPNGGYRSKATAGRLKAEGVKRGVPDVCLPVPRGGYGALYIELKVPAEAGRCKGATQHEQVEWLFDLRAVGNSANIAYGWLAARDLIEGYLRG